jgi:hypothetical protein
MSRLPICLFALAMIPVTASVHAGGSPAAKCAAAKQKAAVKKIAAKLKCYQKAAATGDPVDSGCLTAAEGKFDAAVAKANAKGGCVRTGDAPTIEAAADRCVSDIGNQTPSELPTCGSTPYPECGGSCPAGQKCQALLATRFASNESCGDVNECTSRCECRGIDAACDGHSCGQICTARTTCIGQGNFGTTETCCAGDGQTCDEDTGSMPCCCAGTCFQLAGGLGTCQSGLECSSSHPGTVCQ